MPLLIRTNQTESLRTPLSPVDVLNLVKLWLPARHHAVRPSPPFPFQPHKTNFQAELLSQTPGLSARTFSSAARCHPSVLSSVTSGMSFIFHRSSPFSPMCLSYKLTGGKCLQASLKNCPAGQVVSSGLKGVGCTCLPKGTPDGNGGYPCSMSSIASTTGRV